MPVTPIKVLLVEDHLIVRQGLRDLLKLEADIAVIGEAENGRIALALVAKLRPDVVVMDVAMPLLNGLEATRQILLANPSVRILVLSAHGDDTYVEQFMKLGAAGYLIKQTASHILPAAIRDVHMGKPFFSPDITKRRKTRQRKDRAAGDSPKMNPATLTSREMEVLQLVAEGKANKETADALHISIKTVEKHRQQLMKKLDIHDTASLTRYAISTGIIESSVQVTIL
jgi:DNA-binding NarL/FixJ family response regulator